LRPTDRYGDQPLARLALAFTFGLNAPLRLQSRWVIVPNARATGGRSRLVI
jgi:hypothetical protein